MPVSGSVSNSLRYRARPSFSLNRSTQGKAAVSMTRGVCVLMRGLRRRSDPKRRFYPAHGQYARSCSTVSAAGRPAAGQGGAELIDAKGLEEDVLQAVLACLDERMAGVIAIRGHQYQARLGLGLAQA